MDMALPTRTCNTVHYKGAALWLASHNFDQNPENTITYLKLSTSLPMCTLLITQHSASWNVAAMDVTVLEEAISHFLPFTPPLSKFSAGCFSSCKFQIKIHSCTCKEHKKNFVINYTENAGKYTSEIVMSWHTYSVSYYHYNWNLQCYMIQLTELFNW